MTEFFAHVIALVFVLGMAFAVNDCARGHVSEEAQKRWINKPEPHCFGGRCWAPVEVPAPEEER